MVVWLIRIGWCSACLGILLFTPAAELFPVELWMHLKNVIAGTPTGSSHVYLRVMQGADASVDPLHLIGAALLVFGLLLLGAGYWMRLSR